MNILELCLSPAYGGLEIHVRDFCIWLSSRKEVSLSLALQEGSEIEQRLADLTCPSITFLHIAAKFPLKMARSLAGFIDEHQIDIIHMHWKDDLPLAALSKRLSKRNVCLAHSRHMLLPGNKHDIYHRFIYKPVDKYITITKDLKEQAEKNLPISNDKIEYIYYGVEPPNQLTNTEKEKIKKKFHIDHRFTVGLIGRIHFDKKQHLFIEAIEILKKEGVDIFGVIVGSSNDDEYSDQIRKYTVDHSLEEHVIFSGFYERPTDLMQCFDALVMPSGSETFGLVLIEGMHCGIPVIGSNKGGVPEIIDHGINGLMFEGDDVHSLVESINRLYHDNALRIQLAQAGQKKAREMFVAEEQYKKVLTTLANC